MALDQPIMFLPEDPLGTSISNKILGETHELGELHTIIKPHMTAYYSDSLVVTAIDSSDVETVLVRGVDYKCVDLFEKLTLRTGKEVCGSILFIRDIPQREFVIDYQAFGGTHFANYKAIAGVIADSLNRELIEWEDIVGKPLGFPPIKGHQHDWKDIYGTEYLVAHLNAIADAIRNRKNMYDLDINRELSRVTGENSINLRGLYSTNSMIRSSDFILKGLSATISRYSDYIKDYFAFKYNNQLALVLAFIVNDNYTRNPGYNNLYHVPKEIDGLHCWIDFSDTNSFVVEPNSKISSITDKSPLARIFSQNTDAFRPLSINNLSYGVGQINGLKSARFQNDNKLIQTSGPAVSIGEEFTIIILARIKTTPGDILSNSTSTDKFTVNDPNFRVFNLFSQKYLIRSPINSTSDNKFLLNFLSVGKTDRSIIWNVNNFGNDDDAVYGLEFFQDTVSIPSLVFDIIGNSSIPTQDYEVSEIIIYDRQLSLVEAEAIQKYLSRKWSGATDFEIDMSLANLNSSDPTPESFWLYLDTNTP